MEQRAVGVHFKLLASKVHALSLISAAAEQAASNEDTTKLRRILDRRQVELCVLAEDETEQVGVGIDKTI